MKARDLKRLLRLRGWWDTGRGSKHEKWTNGIHTIAVPRHKGVAEGTARAILKEADEYGQKEEES
ncbi:MAG TPA: type II toxin-antitoxin system HicA family toxin [Bdellovibrionota bacterium]|nr:type II toxin-antitoxin system HicA family toxin [Bdellovibrionota bacterium]